MPHNFDSFYGVLVFVTPARSSCSFLKDDNGKATKNNLRTYAALLVTPSCRSLRSCTKQRSGYPSKRHLSSWTALTFYAEGIRSSITRSYAARKYIHQLKIWKCTESCGVRRFVSGRNEKNNLLHSWRFLRKWWCAWGRFWCCYLKNELDLYDWSHNKIY